jgi:hypothetical protein
LDIDPAATNVGGFDFDLYFDPSVLTIDLPAGVSRGADTAAGWAVTSRLVEAGQLRVGMINAQGTPLAAGLKEIARLVLQVTTHVDASLRDAISAGLGEAGLREEPVSERPGYVVLDLEAVDPRAGGYVWTAVDGSLAIAVPNVWHNAGEPCDVDGDGEIAPADVLALINYLNVNPGQSALPLGSRVPAAFCDVNNDRACTAIDVLAVINRLNAQAATVTAESERADVASVGSAAFRRLGEDRLKPALRTEEDRLKPARPTLLAERVLRDEATDLTRLGPLLDELADDIATAWRRK